MPIVPSIPGFGDDKESMFQALQAMAEILRGHGLAGADTSIQTSLQSSPAHTHVNEAEGGNELDTPAIPDFSKATHDHANDAGGGNSLDTPTIADFTNATHNHSDDSEGGTLASGLVPPTGQITEFGGTTAPTGYLLCDGSEVSKTTFAALFAVIGTAFDNSPAGGNFNVPDLRGRVGIGLDNLGGSSADRMVHANADTLGGAAGAETHTLVTGELASHNHIQNAHNHGTSGPNPNFITFKGGGGVSNPAGGVDQFGSPSVTGNRTPTNQVAGGGGAHRNDQPWLAVSKIIKT